MTWLTMPGISGWGLRSISVHAHRGSISRHWNLRLQRHATSAMRGVYWANQKNANKVATRAAAVAATRPYPGGC